MDPSSPRISVIVPTRNAERFIEHCLESVLAQTLAPFEILVCDDLSVDGTRDRVARLARDDSRIRAVFHDHRQGISRNFNSGLEAARGDFVTLVAGDDFWGPGKLQQEVQALRATGRSWAYSKVASCDESGKTLRAAANTADALQGDVLPAVIARKLAPRSPLIARELLQRVGPFDPAFALFEDWDLRIRLAAAAPVAHAPGEEVVYRHHSGGSSRSPLALRLEMALKVLRRHRSLVRSLGPEFLHSLRHDQLQWFRQRFDEESAQGAIRAPDQSLACRTLLLEMEHELSIKPSSAAPAPKSGSTRCTG